MASLSLKNVCKVYPNGFEAVKDFNLDVADKEFIIFVGPSGCGKSTFYRSNDAPLRESEKKHQGYNKTYQEWET